LNNECIYFSFGKREKIQLFYIHFVLCVLHLMADVSLLDTHIGGRAQLVVVIFSPLFVASDDVHLFSAINN
jgi:hypothetical protein